MEKYGFIGTGNMGSALVKAVSKKVPAENIILNDVDLNKAEKLASQINCKIGSLKETTEFADFIYIGIKPQSIEKLFDEFGPLLRNTNKRIILVSMLAGTEINKIELYAGKKIPIIRIMPNIACSIGEGTTLYTANSEVTKNELKIFADNMEYSGLCIELPEKLINAGSAISGCGPAFIFMMAEALADAGVECGLSRKISYELAAQTISGSGKLIIESGRLPASLKDDVCSPGGTTIEGVFQLENGNFRASVMKAVKASYEKNFKL